jgi:hypothetical protein
MMFFWMLGVPPLTIAPGSKTLRELFDKALLPFIESDLRTAMMNGEIEPEPPEPLAVVIGGAIVHSANHIALTTPRGKREDELERFRRALGRLLERLRIV